MKKAKTIGKTTMAAVLGFLLVFSNVIAFGYAIPSETKEDPFAALFRNLKNSAQNDSIDIDTVADRHSVIIRTPYDPALLPETVHVIRTYKYNPFHAVSITGPGDLKKLKAAGIKYYPNLKYQPDWQSTKWLKNPEIPKEAFSKAVQMVPGKYYPYIGTFPTFLNETAHMLGADQLWAKGITGKKTVIAIIDTGIDKTHPLLDDMDDNPATNDPKVIGEISLARSDRNPDDRFLHGTAVAAIAAGTGGAGGNQFFSANWQTFHEARILPYTQKGMAPQAYLLNIKVFERDGGALLDTIIAGVEYAMDHGADVINLSLGTIPFEENPIGEVLDKASAQGIVVVKSAGNSGPGHYSVETMAGFSAIDVAAVYETGAPVYFSSRGPAAFGPSNKPDIAAPGAEVMTALPLWASKAYLERELFFVTWWGTSFSAPHITGLVALLLQEFPGASPMAIKVALLKTATFTGKYDVTEVGSGVANVSKAYEFLLASKGKVQQYDAPQKIIQHPTPIPEHENQRGLFVGHVEVFGSFLRELRSRGMSIDSYGITSGLPLYMLKDYDVLILAQVWNKDDLVSFEQTLEQFLHSGPRKSVLWIGDEIPAHYTKILKKFGISYVPGLVVGGNSSEIVSHPTTGGIRTLFFPSAVAGLQVNISLAKLIAFDSIHVPMIAVWQKNDAKLMVVADQDLLTDNYLERADNRQFGYQTIRWLLEDVTIIRPDVSVKMRYPTFFTPDEVGHFSFNIANHGNALANVNLTVTIKNSTQHTVFDTFVVIESPVKTDRAVMVNYTFSVLEKKEKPKQTFSIEGKASLEDKTQKDRFSYNNKVAATIDVIDKNPRQGINPAITMLVPRVIDSLTPPVVTMFPGDFKALNITIFTSAAISNGRLVVEGNSDAVQFSNASNAAVHRNMTWGDSIREPIPKAFKAGPQYSAGRTLALGTFTGAKTVAIQILPKSPGIYREDITLYDGETVVGVIPVSLQIQQPKARLLYDDVHDGFFAISFDGFIISGQWDAERLWGGQTLLWPGNDVYAYWKALAIAGYDIDSLSQRMYELGYKDTDGRKALMDFVSSGEYQGLIIHDKEGHGGNVGEWTKIIQKVNIITHFDSDFRFLHSAIPQQVFVDGGAGFGVLSFLENPITKGFNGTVPFLGGVKFGVIGNHTQTVANLRDFLITTTGATVAAVYDDPSGHKHFLFGDSAVFEWMNGPDLAWLAFQGYPNVEELGGWEKDTAKFAVLVADYVMRPGTPYRTLDQRVVDVEQDLGRARQDLGRARNEIAKIGDNLEQAKRELKKDVEVVKQDVGAARKELQQEIKQGDAQININIGQAESRLDKKIQTERQNIESRIEKGESAILKDIELTRIGVIIATAIIIGMIALAGRHVKKQLERNYKK